MRYIIILLLCFLTIHPMEKAPSFESSVEALQKNFDGQVGVSVMNVQTGAIFGYNQTSAFPSASTRKVPLVCAFFDRQALNEKNCELVQEALVVSDNTAADTLFKRLIINVNQIEQPSDEELTQYFNMWIQSKNIHGMKYFENIWSSWALDHARRTMSSSETQYALSNMVTELKNTEDIKLQFVGKFVDQCCRRMDQNIPLNVDNDPNTTTPQAMTYFLQALVDGKIIADDKCTYILNTMTKCETGPNRIVPAIQEYAIKQGLKLKVAHKTGTGTELQGFGSGGICNDVGIIFQQTNDSTLGQPVMILSVFLKNSTELLTVQEALIQKITLLALERVIKQNMGFRLRMGI